MKQIEKWVADDGSEWTTAQGAKRRDEIVERVGAILSQLVPPPRPGTPASFAFGAGTGFIQQNKRMLERVTNGLFELCRVTYRDHGREDPVALPVINAAQERLKNIDASGREWRWIHVGRDQNDWSKIVCIASAFVCEEES